MTVTVSGSQITFNDNSIQNTAATGFGFKNRIINGDCRIDQRNAGASVSTTPTDAIYTLDRWMAAFSTATRYTVQQNAGSVTPPAGFTNYLGVTSSAATSVGSSDYYFLQQIIEGFNVADLGWGTASAATITLSFWVRSSLTGTFGGALTNGGQNRSYPFSYTISSSNTWEQKTITIAGDTSGTWLTNNGAGIRLRFGLGVGSTFSGTAGSWSGSNFFSTTGATSVVGTNGATFYITGVQLEKGSTATSFDYRPYGQELALCQRYYQIRKNGSNYSGTVGAFGFAGSSGTGVATLTTSLPVEMRAFPTVAYTGTVALNRNQANYPITSLSNYMGTSSGFVDVTVSSGLSGGDGVILIGVADAASISFSSEL